MSIPPLRLPLILGVGLSPITHGAEIFKANNDDDISLVTSWWDTAVGTTNPGAIGATDTLWFGTGQAADRTLSLGADLTIGALRLDNTSGSPNHSVTLNAGNEITLNGNNDYTSGVAQGIVLNSGTGGSFTIDADLALGASQRWVSSRNLTVNGNVNLGANDLTLWSAGGTTRITGIISGTGGLNRDHNSNGNVVLTGVNTYTGNTTINTGTVEIGESGSLGSGAYAGSIALQTASVDRLFLNTTADQTLSGVISGGGTLAKDNSGTLTLTGNNSYSGGTIVDGGTLQIGTGAGSTGSFGSGDVTIADGATVIWNRTTDTQMTNNISGGGTLVLRGGSNSNANNYTNQWLAFGDNTGSGGAGVVSGIHLDTGASATDRGEVILTHKYGDGTTKPKLELLSLTGYGHFRSDWGTGADRTISVNQDIDTTYQGRIIQHRADRSIHLEKLGTGTLTLTGNNSYTNTNVGGGTLQVGDGGTSGALGAGLVTVDSGAELIFNRSNAFTIANVFDGTGTITKAGAGRMTVTGDNSGAVRTWNFDGTGNGDIGFSNPDRIGASGSKIVVQDNGIGSFFFSSGGVSTDVQLEIGAGGSLNWNGGTGSTYTGTGVISGGGQFIKQSGSTLILTADNTYSGGTLVENGFLQIGDGGATGSLGTGNIVVQSSNDTLRINRNNTYTVADVISGGGHVVQQGSGTTILSGENTYTGSTTVLGGTLEVNGRTGSGIVDVSTGAALSGSGTIGGTATVSGMLNPGNSPGTLTFEEDLTLESTSTTTIEIASLSSFDILANDGEDTLTASGTLALELFGYTPIEGDTFAILENWGGFAGSFDTITGTNLGGGLSFDTSDLLTNGTLTVVPEPSSLLLIGFGLFGLSARRRR